MIAPPPLKRILRQGMSGEDVRTVQALLQSQGHFQGWLGGNFQTLTLNAVIYFQMTHQGPNGRPLVVDGVVGPATWWALHNPSGQPQRSGLPEQLPSGLGGLRESILKVALAEHADGAREIPDGSNWGPFVSKYTSSPNPWCAFFAAWCVDQAHKWPFANRGHCLTIWREAGSKGMAHAKAGYSPIPGDMFLMLYRTPAGQLRGTGHIGFVMRVAANGSSFNTIEGNTGNRVKIGTRQKAQGTLEGFINFLPDENPRFQRGLVSAASTANAATR